MVNPQRTLGVTRLLRKDHLVPLPSRRTKARAEHDTSRVPQGAQVSVARHSARKSLAHSFRCGEHLIQWDHNIREESLNTRIIGCPPECLVAGRAAVRIQCMGAFWHVKVPIGRSTSQIPSLAYARSATRACLIRKLARNFLSCHPMYFLEGRVTAVF